MHYQSYKNAPTTITKTKALQSSNHFPLLLLALLMRVVMRAPLRTPAPKRRPLLISSFRLMYGSSKSPAYIRLRGISYLWCNTNWFSSYQSSNIQSKFVIPPKAIHPNAMQWVNQLVGLLVYMFLKKFSSFRFKGLGKSSKITFFLQSGQGLTPVPPLRVSFSFHRIAE